MLEAAPRSDILYFLLFYQGNVRAKSGILKSGSHDSGDKKDKHS